mgnify:CR=1 FL=1
MRLHPVILLASACAQLSVAPPALRQPPPPLILSGLQPRATKPPGQRYLATIDIPADRDWNVLMVHRFYEPPADRRTVHGYFTTDGHTSLRGKLHPGPHGLLAELHLRQVSLYYSTAWVLEPGAALHDFELAVHSHDMRPCVRVFTARQLTAHGCPQMATWLDRAQSPRSEADPATSSPFKVDVGDDGDCRFSFDAPQVHELCLG